MRVSLGGLLLIGALLEPTSLSAQTDLSCPWPAPAQFLTDRASPPDSAVLQIGDALLKVCYSRPSARGRAVMGEMVRYGRLWRTGANEPTMLLLSLPLEVAGIHLDAGGYILHTVPGYEEWSIVLNTAQGRTAEELFRSMAVLDRRSVAAGRTDEHVETFTIRGIGSTRQGNLILEWERTRIEIPVSLPRPGGSH